MKKNTSALDIKVLSGIPASGKTTYRQKFLADNPDYVAVSRDDFRLMLRNQVGISTVEPLVSMMVKQAVLTALQNGKSVLVDATHCKESYLNEYNMFKDLFPVKISYEFFDITLEEAIERDAARMLFSVGPEVITKMHENYEQMKKSPRYKQIVSAKAQGLDQAIVFERVTQDPTLAVAVIFDVDGTLALMNGKRKPYDWHRVGEDDLCEIVKEHVLMNRSMGRRIIIMSGRDEVCRQETYDWLVKHEIPFDDLFMRPEKDMRKDSLIKDELFRTHVLPNYYTKVVYDDRNQVVELWRALGLTCFQVAESPD
jgi:predicted kinase